MNIGELKSALGALPHEIHFAGTADELLTTAAGREQVGSNLKAFMPEQRWFANKGAAGDSSKAITDLRMRNVQHFASDDQRAALLGVEVDQADGTKSLYRHMAAVRGLDEVTADQARHATALVHASDGDFLLLDGMADTRSVIGMAKVAMGGHVSGIADIGLVGHGTNGPLEALEGEAKVKMLSTDSSNSMSVITARDGTKLFAKLTRLDPLDGGESRSAAILNHLTELGSRDITPQYGTASVIEHGAQHDIFEVQDFWPAPSGIEHAESAFNDALEAHASGSPARVEQAMRSFEHSARELGRTTGRVHVDLTRGKPGSKFTSFEPDVGLVRAGRTFADDEMAKAFAGLKSAGWKPTDGGSLDSLGTAARHELASVREAVDSSAAAPTRWSHGHGDLHLGQILQRLSEARVTDFEGAPGKSMKERWRPGPAIEEVARMMGSYEYAGFTQLQTRMAEQFGIGADELKGMTHGQLIERYGAGNYASEKAVTDAMATRAANAYLSGWRETVAGSAIEPHPTRVDAELKEALMANAGHDLWYDALFRPDSGMLEVSGNRMQRLVAVRAAAPATVAPQSA